MNVKLLILVAGFVGGTALYAGSRYITLPEDQPTKAVRDARPRDQATETAEEDNKNLEQSRVTRTEPEVIMQTEKQRTPISTKDKIVAVGSPERQAELAKELADAKAKAEAARRARENATRNNSGPTIVSGDGYQGDSEHFHGERLFGGSGGPSSGIRRR
jgi:hypothetical protein